MNTPNITYNTRTSQVKTHQVITGLTKKQLIQAIFKDFNSNKINENLVKDPIAYRQALPKYGRRIFDYFFNRRNMKYWHFKNKTIAAIVGCTPYTIKEWTNKFVDEGILVKVQQNRYAPNFFKLHPLLMRSAISFKLFAASALFSISTLICENPPQSKSFNLNINNTHLLSLPKKEEIGIFKSPQKNVSNIRTEVSLKTRRSALSDLRKLKTLEERLRLFGAKSFKNMIFTGKQELFISGLEIINPCDQIKIMICTDVALSFADLKLAEIKNPRDRLAILFSFAFKYMHNSFVQWPLAYDFASALDIDLSGGFVKKPKVDKIQTISYTPPVKTPEQLVQEKHDEDMKCPQKRMTFLHNEVISKTISLDKYQNNPSLGPDFALEFAISCLAAEISHYKLEIAQLESQLISTPPPLY